MVERNEKISASSNKFKEKSEKFCYNGSQISVNVRKALVVLPTVTAVHRFVLHSRKGKTGNEEQRCELVNKLCYGMNPNMAIK